MKILTFLVVFGLSTLCCVHAFMGLDLFTKTILPNCFGRRNSHSGRELPHGQELPIPNTIEAFIGIVEKLEFQHREWRAVDLIKTLLLNFRYDDVIVNENSAKSRGQVSWYYDALIKLFNKPSQGQQLRSDDLTQDERCALFFMISHSVNDTYTEGEEFIEIDGRRVLRNRRELGVVTMSSQTKHAFALGKVLLGLLAGMERMEGVNANNILIELGSVGRDELQNVLISVLYAATFGDIVSITKSSLKDNVQQAFESLFYMNGRWDEPVCPTDYFLEENNYGDPHGSLSLIRGAYDGYRLGSNIRDLTASNSKWKLSQIIRTYYGGSGFPGNQGLSYCDRILLKLDTLKNEAVNFDKLHTALNSEITKSEKIAQDIDRIFSLITGQESKLFQDIREENDLCASASSTTVLCDTPVDVLAILDMKAVEQRSIQSSTVGNVSSGMSFGGTDGSSVSVYSNLKSYGGGFELDSLINGSRYSGCGGCAAHYYDPARASYNNEVEVFQYLNFTLGKMIDKDDDDDSYGAPAKAVLYFNYQSPPAESRLRTAVKELGWRYRGVQIFSIGSREDVLKIFSDDFVTNSNPDKIRLLKERVCKVPAQFLYPNCYKSDTLMEKNERFEGFITPKRSQYWMMDPKYFHRSFNIKLSFKALTGEIRVCYSRDYRKIFEGREPNGADCGITVSGGTELVFKLDNPCHRYTEYTCRPFYFYIEGRTPPKDNEPCNDERCRSPDQISYEFVHEGISCNGANSLFAISSIMMIMLSVVLRTQ